MPSTPRHPQLLEISPHGYSIFSKENHQKHNPVMNIPVSFVFQKDCFHCFPACLSSFLKDNGKDVTQDQIVDSCPTAFAKGSNIHGAFSPESFPLLIQSFPITVTPIISPSFIITHPKQTAVFLVDWQKTGQWHWVRFAGQDSQEIYLMNPLITNKADVQDVSDFASWPKVGFIIEYAG